MKHCIYILSLFLCSCASIENSMTKGEYVINLDSIQKEKTLEFTSLYNSKKLTILVLDTVQNALLGSIDKIGITNQCILVLDKDTGQKLLAFDKQGKFLRQIGKIGQGPGEYSRISDFTYSQKENSIFILDYYLQKIHVYNLSTGKFIRSFPAHSNSYFIHYFNGSIYADNPTKRGAKKTESLLSQISANDGGNINSFISPQIWNSGWDKRLANTGGPFLTFNQQGVRYSHYFANTIFKGENDEIIPFLTFESKDWMKEKDWEGLDPDNDDRSFFRKLIQIKKYYDIHDYMEWNNKIFCTFSKGLESHYVYADLEHNKKLHSMSLFENILFNNVNFEYIRLRLGAVTETGAYYYLIPEQLNEFLQYSDKLSPLGKMQVKQLLGKNDNFNGAIFYYEFKE